jgi:uncharacterized repeat protein (TIGR02543 family)
MEAIFMDKKSVTNKNFTKCLTVMVLLLTVFFAGCEQPVEPGEVTFTVTFDIQGGTPQPQASIVNEGAVINPLPVVTKADYTFQGWYTEAAGGTEFTVTTPVTGDITLYARWEAVPVTFTVTFDVQGGTPQPQASIVNGGTVINPLPVVTKADYTFQGWYTEAAGGTEFTVTTPVTGNMTLYARWEAIVPSILPLLHHDFNPVNYTGGVFAPAVGDSVSTKGTPAGSGWLSGSGTGNGKTFHFYKTGDKKAMNAAGVTYLDLGTGTGTILNNASQGYTIAAYVRIEGDWSGAGNMIWAFATTNAVGQSTGQAIWFSGPSSSHATTTLTGGWSGPTNVAQAGAITQNTWHHVAYTQNGKEGPDNAKVYVDGTQVATGTVALLPNDFGVFIFNTLGGPCFTSDNNLSQTMFTDFRIYNTALDATQIATLAGNLNDLKAVTQWTPSGFFKTLTFNSNSGGVANPAPVYVLEGGTVPSLPVPTREGYDFSGWYTQISGGDRFTTSTTVTSSVTLYARWNIKPTIVGASGTTVDASAPNLLDGDLATRWTTNRLNQFYHMDMSFRDADGNLIATGDPAGLNGYRHWITIDLGQAIDNISKLEYYPRDGGNVNQLVEDCEIYASEEVNLKINIQRAINAGLAKKVGAVAGWDVTSSTGWRPAITFTADGTAAGIPAPVKARYIQLRVTKTTQGTTGTYQMAAGEIRLYTTDGMTDTVLVYPAGTQAYGSSQNNDQRGMLPMMVIDGNTNTNWLSGNINVTSAFNQTDFDALKTNLPADPHFDVGHWITLDLGASPEAYTGLMYHRRRDNVSTGNFSGVEIYTSDNAIDPAVSGNTGTGMSLVKTFTGLPIGNLNNVERWTLLDFSQAINKRYLHIRITGEIYSANAGYGNEYNAGPDTGSEVQPTSGGQLGVMWGSADAAEFTVVR